MTSIEHTPRLILIAAPNRSGGTWLFNAVRRCFAAAGLEAAGYWVEDWDRAISADAVVVKAHLPSEVDFEPDLILTAHRDLHERMASLIRLGWVENARAAVVEAARFQELNAETWRRRSNLEIAYEDILARPETVLARLADVLKLKLSKDVLGDVVADLAAMRAPSDGQYDPVTLMHPAHRGDPEETRILADKVRRWLAEDETGTS